MIGRSVCAAVLPYEALNGLGFFDHIEPGTVDVLGDDRREQCCTVLGELVLDHNIELGPTELLRGRQPAVTDDDHPPGRNVGLRGRCSETRPG